MMRNLFVWEYPSVTFWSILLTTFLLQAICSAAFIPSTLKTTRAATSSSLSSTEGLRKAHRQRQQPFLTTSRVILHAADASRNKKVGGGFAVTPPGDLKLFDPNLEGKQQGTNELEERVRNGPQFSPAVIVNGATATTVAAAPPSSSSGVLDAQHWLEHLDVPVNFAKPTQPATATILGSLKIIGEDAPGDIRHVMMRLPDGMHYVEGQSLSVIPPGVDVATGRSHKPRLYSIASTRYGDMLDGTTVSLCVRRAEYYDPVTNLPDPAKKGVCSHFLCDAAPGTQVSVAGPVGKTMLLPKDPNADVIMIATGTGIAPFRAFLHRLFMEHTVARHMFGGTAWLVLGVPTTSGLLYDEEFKAMQNNANPGAFKIDYAISREMTNAAGGKLYVQDVIEQNAQEFFQRLDGGANVYFCGLKKMMPPILETMERVAAARGLVWADKLKEWKENHQWHVEVY